MAAFNVITEYIPNRSYSHGIISNNYLFCLVCNWHFLYSCLHWHFSGLLILISYFVRAINNLFNKRFINKGSAIAHIGLGLLFFVVSMNSILSYEKNLNISLDQTVAVDESVTAFSFDDIKVIKASNHDIISAEVSIRQDGKNVLLNPQKRKYITRGQITSESAIQATILKDTYLTIGDQLENGSWTFSLKINYFIRKLQDTGFHYYLKIFR